MRLIDQVRVKPKDYDEQEKSSQMLITTNCTTLRFILTIARGAHLFAIKLQLKLGMVHSNIQNRLPLINLDPCLNNDVSKPK